MRHRQRWCLGGVQPKNAKGPLSRPRHNALLFLGNLERAKGFEPLDPNLGKVVLYP